MSGGANTTLDSALEKAGENLHWVLQTTEGAIGALISGFHGLTGDVDIALNLAAGIVERVEDKNVCSVLPSVHSLGEVAKQFVGDRLRATAGILDTVSQEMQLLRRLSLVTDGQAKIALEIKVLNVHTKVEVAHLGAVGAGFEYLARELAEFSTSLAKNTQELTNHTESRKAEVQQTKSLLSQEIPQLRDELSQVEVSLSEDLAVLDTGLTKLANTPAKFKQSAEDIAGQIAGVVVAVQGHDITRQQIEHVQEALQRVSSEMLVEQIAISETNRGIGRAYAGLTIQTFQLRAAKATITEWTTQIRICMDCILRIGASDLAGIGPLVLEQERSMSLQLSHIELLEHQCQAYGERIRGTLEGVSHLSQLVGEHLQKSESARNRLRFLTFNSVIEASRLGSKADTICVIADGIAEVATGWSKITEQSGSVLREIMDLSKRVNEVMATFSQTDSSGLGEALEKTRAGLECLRSAAAFAVEQVQKIETWARTMRMKIGYIRESSDLLDACFGRIDEVMTEIEVAKQQIEDRHPGVGETFDASDVEKIFSESYTTQTERDVLRVAIYGGEMPVASQSSMGNSIELF